jgi:hypothetical protein
VLGDLLKCGVKRKKPFKKIRVYRANRRQDFGSSFLTDGNNGLKDSMGKWARGK